jgi:hypothetical protein
MAPLRIRVHCAASVVAFAAVVAIMAGDSAHADLSKTLSDVPRFKLFASSHSTAAAEVMAYHGLKNGLPQVVLIGGLEGRIYRCDCGKGIDLWDIAQGTKLWAAAKGLKVTTEAWSPHKHTSPHLKRRCLKPPGSPCRWTSTPPRFTLDRAHCRK